MVGGKAPVVFPLKDCFCFYLDVFTENFLPRRGEATSPRLQQDLDPAACNFVQWLAYFCQGMQPGARGTFWHCLTYCLASISYGSNISLCFASLKEAAGHLLLLACLSKGA
jgi:hypothetical protein